MSRSIVRSFAQVCFFTSMLLLSGSITRDAHAAKKGESKLERSRAAQQLVEQAVQYDTAGDASQRSTLLSQAVEQAPDLPLARWSLGQMQHKHKWVSVEDAAAELTKSAAWKTYVRMRANSNTGSTTQLELARWCDAHKLPEQARAHWTAVLDQDANHREARQRLGFRWIDGDWVSREELAESQEAAAEWATNLATWEPRLALLKAGFEHANPLRRQYSQQQLEAINDVTAIPALEALIERGNESLATLAVGIIARMQQLEATQSLAQLAVQARSDTVRQSATAALKGRPLTHFVPSLLASMYTPVQSRAALRRGPNGVMTFRVVLFREGQAETEVAAQEVKLRGRRAPTAAEQARLAERQWRNKTEDRNIDQTIAAANEKTTELNERIGAVLGATTGQTHGSDPTAWWKWWNVYNEVFVEGMKPAKQLLKEDQLANLNRRADLSIPADVVASIVPPAVALQMFEPNSGPRRGFDCLAAGTPVWTVAGPQAIETVRVGDLVLSQDPTSGELAYKPVLRTTIRPRGKLVTVKLQNEELTTSGGHLFWSAGAGWVKSRNIDGQTRLHGLHGTQPSQGAGEGTEAETYNLVVADFHTYFVGQSKLLSHDNTPSDPVDHALPGIARAGGNGR